MTPNEIATNVSGLSSVERGNLNASVNYTYSLVVGGKTAMDDSNTWDR